MSVIVAKLPWTWIVHIVPGLSIDETLTLFISIFLNNLDHCVNENTNANNGEEEGEATEEDKDPVEEVPSLRLDLTVGSLLKELLSLPADLLLGFLTSCGRVGSCIIIGDGILSVVIFFPILGIVDVLE